MFPPGIDGYFFFFLLGHTCFWQQLGSVRSSHPSNTADHLILPSPWIPLCCITVVNLRALDRSSIAFESKLCPVNSSKHKRCLWTAGCVWVQAKTEIPLSCWYGCVSSALCASSSPPPTLTLQGPSVLWLTLPPPFCVFFLFLFLSPFLCFSTCLLFLTGIFPFFFFIYKTAGPAGRLSYAVSAVSVCLSLCFRLCPSFVYFSVTISLLSASLTVVVKRPTSTLCWPLLAPLCGLSETRMVIAGSGLHKTHQNTSEQFGPVNLMTSAVNVTTA